MSSLSTITENRRRLKLRMQGRKRKRKTAQKSTLSYEELFAALGAPSEPTPKKK
jgi:hypothetical protein